jgi:hypothetical protein
MDRDIQQRVAVRRVRIVADRAIRARYVEALMSTCERSVVDIVATRAELVETSIEQLGEIAAVGRVTGKTAILYRFMSCSPCERLLIVAAKTGPVGFVPEHPREVRTMGVVATKAVAVGRRLVNHDRLQAELFAVMALSTKPGTGLLES